MWRPTSISPGTYIAQVRPPAVRITAKGETITFRNPTMINDSIVGFDDLGAIWADPQDVTLFEVRSFSSVKTAALFISHAAVVVGFVSVVIWIQPHYSGF